MTADDHSQDDGYVTDIEYVTGFQHEMAPSWLATMATLAGHRPPDLARPYRWAEIGCGNGLTAVAIAAMNPGAEVWGFDFNPACIEHARGLAATVGASNARFECASFAGLASAADGAHPDFTFIAAHGVLSWVGPERRREAMAFISRRIALGGLVHLSHNVDAGWSPVRPLHGLMHMVASAPGPDGKRRRTDLAVPDVLGFVERLRAGGARYFEENPTVAPMIEELAGQDPRYVAHEHLNGHWEPLSFAAVADLAGSAGLRPVGSATPTDNHDEGTFPAGLMAMAASLADRRLKETVRDLACARRFRRDIYARGDTALDRPAHEAAVDAVRIAGVGVPSTQPVRVACPLGIVEGVPDRYVPLLGRLLDGPMTVGEMATMPTFAGLGAAHRRHALATLLGAGLAQPLLPGSAAIASTTAVSAFNAEIGHRNAGGASLTMIGAPNAGTCIGAPQAETLVTAVLDAMDDGRAAPDGRHQDRLVTAAIRKLEAGGGVLWHGTERIADLDTARATVAAVSGRMLAGRRRKALEDLGTLRSA